MWRIEGEDRRTDWLDEDIDEELYEGFDESLDEEN